MKTRPLAALSVACLMIVAPLTSHAELSAYSQDFESVLPAEPLGGGSNSGLSDDGWIVYGNVFNPDGSYVEGYGSYPAPNGRRVQRGVREEGQGGPSRVSSSWRSTATTTTSAHDTGQWVEANVFHEQTIAAGDVGTTWIFQFDAKLGNLVAPSTALAFIKTLDPANGYQPSALASIDMTAIPATWDTYTISFTITAGRRPDPAVRLFQHGDELQRLRRLLRQHLARAGARALDLRADACRSGRARPGRASAQAVSSDASRQGARFGGLFAWSTMKRAGRRAGMLLPFAEPRLELAATRSRALSKDRELPSDPQAGRAPARTSPATH